MRDNKFSSKGTDLSEHEKTIFSKEKIEEFDLKVSADIDEIKSRTENKFIPIARFNRGEVSKIFDEVNESGIKIVLKNKLPVCVLVKPELYEEMIEALDDYELYIEAEKRMKNAESEGFISQEKVYAALGINEQDLEDIEVEIE